MDEFHAAQTWDTFNVMKSSMGMRTQPLMITITTAGFLLNPYPLYTYTETAKDILSGIKHDDSQFSMLYTLDEDDNWKDETNWIKSCPSLGETVSFDYLREQVNAAINTVALENGVKTKNLNLFCESQTTWISSEILRDCMDPVNIEDFKDELAYGGCDLSSVSDLSSFSIMFPPNPEREKWPDKYIFKTYLYVPQDTMETGVNSAFYKIWKNQGYVKQTSGNVVDYDYILADLIKVDNQVQLMNFAYDAYNSVNFIINATDAGVICQPYSQSLSNFNKPTKYFELLVKQNKVILDLNPTVLWCFSNVELKFDFNENCKPVKSGGDHSKKIDATISIIESLGAYLENPNSEPSVTAM